MAQDPSARTWDIIPGVCGGSEKAQRVEIRMINQLEKPYCQQKYIERWKNTKCSTKIEATQVNRSLMPRLLDQKLSYQESADHKKHRHPLRAVSEWRDEWNL